MNRSNRQWRLARRPVGMVEEADFSLDSEGLPSPADGQVLVATRWLSFEPAMRGWMEDRPNYLPPVGLGEVMRGMGVGEVIESRMTGFEAGDLVSGMFGWQEWALAGPGLRKIPTGLDPTVALSVLGITGVTAYFGLLEIGQPKAGETVVVSGAAGATGSVVGQIARLKGCRVIGISGGPEKCAWLTEKAGFDAAIDYKSEDVAERLAELCPEGLDVYFDNVGGQTLDAALGRLAQGARVVICGSISGYNLEETPPGPKNYYNLVQKRARMQGFVILDYFSRFDEAVTQLMSWVDEGGIVWEVDVQTGFENAPHTLQRLYSGANFGKQLLRL